METKAVTYASLLIAALGLLITYLNSPKRTKQIVFRLWVLVSLVVLSQSYARDLYAMLQPGQPANWKTILISHGLLFGLLTYGGAIPVICWYWRTMDKQNK